MGLSEKGIFAVLADLTAVPTTIPPNTAPILCASVAPNSVKWSFFGIEKPLNFLADIGLHSLQIPVIVNAKSGRSAR